MCIYFYYIYYYNYYNIYLFLQVRPASPSTKRITEELWLITKRLYAQTLAAQVRFIF